MTSKNMSLFKLFPSHMKNEEEMALIPYSCYLTHPVCQQDLKGCRPTLDRKPQALFIFFGLLHLLIGIVVLTAQPRFKQYKARYDLDCFESATNSTSIRINIKDKLKGPIYFYYELHGFFHNHFRFQGSFSQNQMLGKYVNKPPEECDPLSKTDGGHVPFPCGLLPNLMFTDTFHFTNGPSKDSFTDKGISWNREAGYLFQKPNEKYSSNLLNKWLTDPIWSINYPEQTLNEHFIVWMRIASKPTFKKLYFKSDDDIEPGEYDVNIKCNYPLSSFDGERWIYLIKPGGLGGKNTPLCIINFVLAIICIICGILFIFKFECCHTVRKRYPARPPEILDILESSSDNSIKAEVL